MEIMRKRFRGGAVCVRDLFSHPPRQVNIVWFLFLNRDFICQEFNKGTEA